MIGFIAIDLVRHCNLGCAKCCHFTPLHTEEWYKDLDSFEVEIKRLKEIVSPTCTFNLVGGEPFLHPDVEKFPGIIRKYIPDAYIFYLTNGTQLNNLSDEQLEILGGPAVDEIGVSKYTRDVYIEPRVFEKLQNIIYHDVTDMFNLCMDLSGSQDYVSNFTNCDQVNHNMEEIGYAGYGTVYERNGIIYPCATAANFDSFQKYFHTNITEFNPENCGINMYLHTREEIEAFITSPKECCKYCNLEKRYTSSSTGHSFSERKISEWTY